MNICIATSNYPPDTGGISTYSQRLAALLHLQGHSAYVLTIDINAPRDQNDTIEIDKNGITIIRLRKSFHHNYRQFQQYFRPGGMDAPYWIAMGRAMLEWLMLHSITLKIDIIEASAFGGIGAFLQHPQLPPVLISGHGAFFQYKEYNQHKEDEQSKLVERLEKLAFIHADGIISHSPQSREDILRYTSRPVYLAAIPIILDKLNENKQLTKKENFGLVVGSLQKLKGPVILCKALSDNRLKNTDFFVRWAGTDNYDHENGRFMSEKLAADYPDNWNKKLIWENTPDDNRLHQLYNEAAFIIIPTIWESFNVISVEAAFHRKPVIITDKTGSSFLFTHGRNAWITPANDVESLADAIVHLHSSPELCKKMGQSAYEEIALQLSPEKIIAERIKIYNNCISKRDKARDIPDLSFLKKYKTLRRNIYFTFRKLTKRLLKK
ncbi:MAG TPA: glycosyltransferase family 4 protein [Chitinophagaceae bacterium]|nr:glycosyltransferase family 4 protein [Chitinophagaceae bacterium]